MNRNFEAAHHALSLREQEVMALLARGLTSAQAARQMDLSPNTVNVHRKRVYKKLGVHTGAAAMARFLGGRVRLDERNDCKCPQCGYDITLNRVASR